MPYSPAQLPMNRQQDSGDSNEGKEHTWRAVVANGKGGVRDGLAVVGVGQRLAGMGVAADLLGLLPDHLGEVAPSTEIAIGRLRSAVGTRKSHHLAVVHGVGEQLSDVVVAVAHVLAIATLAIVTGECVS